MPAGEPRHEAAEVFAEAHGDGAWMPGFKQARKGVADLMPDASRTLVHIDPEPVVAFCRETLPDLDRILPVDALVPSAHGAALAPAGHIGEAP